VELEKTLLLRIDILQNLIKPIQDSLKKDDNFIDTIKIYELISSIWKVLWTYLKMYKDSLDIKLRWSFREFIIACKNIISDPKVLKFCSVEIFKDFDDVISVIETRVHLLTTGDKTKWRYTDKPSYQHYYIKILDIVIYELFIEVNNAYSPIDKKFIPLISSVVIEWLQDWIKRLTNFDWKLFRISKLSSKQVENCNNIIKELKTLIKNSEASTKEHKDLVCRYNIKIEWVEKSVKNKASSNTSNDLSL